MLARIPAPPYSLTGIENRRTGLIEREHIANEQSSRPANKTGKSLILFGTGLVVGLFGLGIAG
jgi:hypothetical protein